MNDQRTVPTGGWGDDPFERELRAILRDRAAGPTPLSIHETLADVTRRSAPRPATGWRRPLVSLVAAAAAVLLLAMGFNPINSWMQAITVPAASPTPDRPVVAVGSPSAQPDASASTSGTSAIDWDNGLVHLTSSSMRLTTEGITYTGIAPDMEVTGDPGGATARTLEMTWSEGGHRGSLNLYLHADGTDWWMEPIGGGNGERSEVGAPIGEAWSGDISMTAADGTLEMRDVTLDAFARETLPGSLLDCEPVAPPLPPETMAETSPLDPGQPLAGSEIETMTPADAKALLTARGFCHLFSYRNGDPSRDGQAQNWCAAPPGRITELFYDSEGAVRIVVQGTEPFARRDPASAFGPGCATGTPDASPAPASQAPASPAVAVAYGWGTGMIRLTADDIVLTANGERIPAPPRLRGENDATRRMAEGLDATWTAFGREQRFILELNADATHWWIARAGLYDNQPQPDLIQFEGLEDVRTPIGQAFHGDISLFSSDGRVPGGIDIKNATLDPTSLGFGPTSFEGCTRYADVPRSLLARLEGYDDPRRVAQLAEANGLCMTYRWVYPTTQGEVGETWCSAPPSGRSHIIHEGPAGEVELIVLDTTRGSVRPQPREGWGCGDTPAPSVLPAPTGPAFAWNGAGVTFTADDLALAAGAGDRQRFTKVPNEVIPTRRRTGPGEVELRWEWHDQHTVRLLMTVQTDGATWRVTEVGYQNLLDSDTVRRWTDVPMQGRLGEAWTGDLDLRPADAKGEKASFQAVNLTLDPGVTTADLEAPPSPTPVADRPFQIDNGRVRLTADRLELSLGDDRLLGPVDAGMSDRSKGLLRRDTFHAQWMDQERLIQLELEFRSDGERWWVTDGWIAAWGMNWAQLDLPQVKGRLGEAFTGDLDLQLPELRTGRGNGTTGETIHLVIKNLSLEPFRGAMPRTMTDCRPVIDSDRIDWKTDPTRAGQPLATKGIVGLPTEKAAGVLEDLGYCYLFDRRLTPDPTLGPTGILETWCDAPPGEVAGLRYGKGGEVHLIVLTEVPKGTPKREQPLMGWGCKADAPVASEPPMPTPQPAASLPPAAPTTDKAYVWDAGAMRVAADDATLTIGDRVIHPEPGVVGARSDDNEGHPHITLAFDEDTEVRVSFTTDGSAWSVHGVEVYGGGLFGGAALTAAGIGAPSGEAFTGDVVITGQASIEAGGQTVTLTLTGAEISAYRPVVARTLRDCQDPTLLDTAHGQYNAGAVGEVLDGARLIGAPARRAADVMQRLGYCYTFSVPWERQRLPNGNTVGGAEVWCDAPDGTITRAVYGEGQIWFEVEPARPIKERPQPPVGWGCLSDVPGYESQQQEAP